MSYMHLSLIRSTNNNTNIFFPLHNILYYCILYKAEYRVNRVKGNEEIMAEDMLS